MYFVCCCLLLRDVEHIFCQTPHKITMLGVYKVHSIRCSLCVPTNALHGFCFVPYGSRLLGPKSQNSTQLSSFKTHHIECKCTFFVDWKMMQVPKLYSVVLWLSESCVPLHRLSFCFFRLLNFISRWFICSTVTLIVLSESINLYMFLFLHAFVLPVV